MINSENINSLKGQNNLAQGKRSGALGWKVERKFVRAVTFIKEKILFRTSEMTFCFPGMMICNPCLRVASRPKGIFYFV